MTEERFGLLESPWAELSAVEMVAPVCRRQRPNHRVAFGVRVNFLRSTYGPTNKIHFRRSCVPLDRVCLSFDSLASVITADIGEGSARWSSRLRYRDSGMAVFFCKGSTFDELAKIDTRFCGTVAD